MSANVSILGNLGRNPELRTAPDGTPIANFSIASNSVCNTAKGKEQKTDWFRVTAIGKQAETLAKHARKGNKLLVQGKLTFSPWKDHENRPQVNANILLQDFQFVGVANSVQTARGRDSEYSVETTIPGGVQDVGDGVYAH